MVVVVVVVAGVVLVCTYPYLPTEYYARTYARLGQPQLCSAHPSPLLASLRPGSVGFQSAR